MTVRHRPTLSMKVKGTSGDETMGCFRPSPDQDEPATYFFGFLGFLVSFFMSCPLAIRDSPFYSQYRLRHSSYESQSAINVQNKGPKRGQSPFFFHFVSKKTGTVPSFVELSGAFGGLAVSDDAATQLSFPGRRDRSWRGAWVVQGIGCCYCDPAEVP